MMASISRILPFCILNSSWTTTVKGRRAAGIIGTLSLIVSLRLPHTATAHVSAGELVKKERREIKRDIIAVLTHRGILTTSVVEAVEYFAYGCLEVFLPIYLHERAGFSPLSIGRSSPFR